MQFKKLLIENNTEYNFCIFNNLQFQRKFDHRKNIQINMVVHYSHSLKT